jgi:putative CocE/NonD family hydrolase
MRHCTTYLIRHGALLSVALATAGCAGGDGAPNEAFDRQQVMIPMRDGIALNTEIYVPKERRGGALPVLLTRTPYGLRHDDDGYHTSLSTSYAELAADGYIFVFQDIRGRYESEGSFVMLRPPRDPHDPDAIDEGTDTYDTIEWVLENVEDHNGRVGILGISYGGWLTVMAMIEPHPAVAAVSPQASPADMYIGDDFLHNGALRLAAAFGYAALMETGKTNRPFQFDQRDAYEWYLDLGPLSNANERYLHGEIPTWNAFMENPVYTEYWKRQAVTPYLTAVNMPTLNVAGWWDAEDFYGPMKIYETLERYDTAGMNFLVVGPWRHGGWARSDGSTLGSVDFGSNTSEYYRTQLQSRFFAYYLKGEGDWDVGEAHTFETGGNRWVAHDAWPPTDAVEVRHLYFHPSGRLAFARRSDPSTEAYDSYVSDPANPVPYMPRPMPGFWQGGQALWKVTDQRFVHRRPDVLSWETEPLEQDVVVAGRIVANLFASSSGTDCDWVVKLIDIYPEDYADDPEMGGFQLMIADDVLRAKFRNGFERPEPVPANEVIEYRIDLNSRYHRFRRGHKIMVQVQSTWFPLIGRNPQTFVNIPTATESDYRKATQRVYRSASFPSHMVLPVIDE